MHSSTLRRVALGCALAIVLALPATASANSVGANLRVEATNGKVLADITQYTSPAAVKADHRARCFGPGSGGSGHRVKVPNPTALGLLVDALPHVPALRPLLLTDHFSFGLGVCGIGGYRGGHPDPFWDVLRDHVAAQVGGDHVKVHDGDQILWYLAPSYPAGDELVLRAPARATPGKPVTATVFAYGDDGKPTSAAGVRIDSGTAPTDAGGQTELVFPSAGRYSIQATRAGDIPSNMATVCVAKELSGCPVHRGRTIFGGPGKDEIRGTGGPDRIFAGAGNDRIAARFGGADRIACGPGDDVVYAFPNDIVRRSCEKVIRR
jgi:RTX calcium-binding nonapeptide repeat (4 copies)